MTVNKGKAQASPRPSRKDLALVEGVKEDSGTSALGMRLGDGRKLAKGRGERSALRRK